MILKINPVDEIDLTELIIYKSFVCTTFLFSITKNEKRDTN